MTILALKTVMVVVVYGFHALVFHLVASGHGEMIKRSPIWPHLSEVLWRRWKRFCFVSAVVMAGVTAALVVAWALILGWPILFVLFPIAPAVAFVGGERLFLWSYSQGLIYGMALKRTKHVIA